MKAPVVTFLALTPGQACRRTPLLWAGYAEIGFKPGGEGCAVVGYIGSVQVAGFLVLVWFPRVMRFRVSGEGNQRDLFEVVRQMRGLWVIGNYVLDTTGMPNPLSSPQNDALGSDDEPTRICLVIACGRRSCNSTRRRHRAGGSKRRMFVAGTGELPLNSEMNQAPLVGERLGSDFHNRFQLSLGWHMQTACPPVRREPTNPD